MSAASLPFSVNDPHRSLISGWNPVPRREMFRREHPIPSVDESHLSPTNGRVPLSVQMFLYALDRSISRSASDSIYLAHKRRSTPVLIPVFLWEHRFLVLFQAQAVWSEQFRHNPALHLQSDMSVSSWSQKQTITLCRAAYKTAVLRRSDLLQGITVADFSPIQQRRKYRLNPATPSLSTGRMHAEQLPCPNILWKHGHFFPAFCGFLLCCTVLHCRRSHILHLPTVAALAVRRPMGRQLPISCEASCSHPP